MERWQHFKNTLSCTECGESRAETLEFHHLKDKDREIGDMVAQQTNWEKLTREMAKCIVLCANCHRVLHHKKKKNKSH